MTKIVLTFGLIAGAILATIMLATMPLYKSGIITFENGHLVGYSSMVIAFSMVFFGVKSYRDNQLGGSITFGKALQVGLLISLVATVMYAIGWEFYYNVYAPDFMDEYAAFVVNKAKSRGTSEAELQQLIAEMEDAKQYYKVPLIRIGMTLTEPLPVGILFSLVTAGLFRNKKFLATQIA